METLIGQLRDAREELAAVLENPDNSVSLQFAAERTLQRMDAMLGVGSAWCTTGGGQR